jgi:hypothetical protein
VDVSPRRSSAGQVLVEGFGSTDSDLWLADI